MQQGYTKPLTSRMRSDLSQVLLWLTPTHYQKKKKKIDNNS